MGDDREMTVREWRERGVFEEPRLSEIIAVYKELGFEVRCEAFEAVVGADCTECMRASANRCRMVYTRKTEGPF